MGYPYTLSDEIMKWAQAIEPTSNEFSQRLELYNQLYDMCVQHWDRGPFTFELFGSCRTTLLLPSSDIDVVIIDGIPHSPPKRSMELLTRRLQRSGLFRNVFFIRSAKVPIIKVSSRSSAMTADISCNVKDGVNGSKFLVDAMAQFPSFKPLYLISKWMLANYELNDASSGGLGSFALSVMLLMYLRTQVRNGTPIGDQLVGFFHFFSFQFDESVNVISFKAPYGSYPRGNFPNCNKHDIVVENPINISHNTASACRKFRQVKQLFHAARCALGKHNPAHIARPAQYFKRGDFGAYPLLCVLNSLNPVNMRTVVKPKVPKAKEPIVISDNRDIKQDTKPNTKQNIKATTKDTEETKGEQKIQKEGKKEEIITIGSDDEDYDSISHTQSKKRKRDGESDSDSEKKPGTSTSTPSSAPTSPSAPSPPSSPKSTIDLQNIQIPTTTAPQFTPTPLPSAPVLPLSTLPKSELVFTKKSSSNSSNYTKTKSSDDSVPPIGFMESFNIPLKSALYVLDDITIPRVDKCTICGGKSFAPQSYDAHISSSYHVNCMLQAGIYC